MKNIILSSIFVVVIFFIGCNDQVPKKDKQSPDTNTSYLIDSPIQGVQYSCDNLNGITDKDGKFLYKDGCVVTFNIGNIKLGEIDSSVIEKYVIINDILSINRNNTRDPKVVLLARFLQSLDSDNNASNGIEISEDTRILLSSVNNKNVIDLTETELTNIVKASNGVLVDEDRAVEHLESTLYDSFKIIVDTVAPVWSNDINYSNINVNEGNKFITTMVAIDKNSVVVYDFVNSEDSNIFDLDKSSGKLSFINPPDYEVAPNNYIVPISATDGFNTTQIDVNINIIDVVDTIDLLSDKNLTVLEDREIGENIGFIDVNLTTNNNINYIKLSGVNADYFRADKNGEIYIVKRLDYEKIKEYNLTATPFNISGKGKNVSLNISVINVPDTRPVLEDSHTFYIDENVTLSTFVGQVKVLYKDIGELDFSIQDIYPDENDTYFVINSDGNITTNSLLDYETVDEYNLTIFATPSGMPDLQSNKSKIRIVVKNILDEIPVLSDVNLSIEENQSIGTTVGRVFVVNSGDSDIVSFDLNGTNSDHFTIDENGVIKTAIVLDYEEINFYELNVTAINRFGRSIGNIVDINVTDKFEVLATMGDVNFTIAENTSPPVVLGDANLLDSGDSNVTEYRLLGLGNEKFSIDNNGSISVISSLDYEDKTFYHFAVGAKNSLGWSEGGDVNITVIDRPDVPPTLKQPYRSNSFVFKIDENATIGTLLSNNPIEVLSKGDSNITNFMIQGNNDIYFDINSSGYIYTDSVLDFETVQVYYFQVVAFNSSMPDNISNEVNVTIYINNIPEFAPELENNQTFTVDENQTIGTIVGELNITNPGDTNITKIILSGDENASHFMVEKNGTIKTTVVLDYETQREYNLVAVATNLFGDSIEYNLTIEVTNIPERYVVLENRDYNISENEQNGTLIGPIAIKDRGDTNITNIILRGDYSDRFRIDIINNDEIFLYTNAILDYEDVRRYFFNIVAVNELGTSDESNITINVTNIYETPPSIKDINFTIPETTPVGTHIGDLNITDRGDSNITEIRILGVAKEDFRVDLNGSIYLVNKLDYSNRQEYNLTGFVRNANGDTNTSSLHIFIEDVILYKPKLNNMTIDINETTAISSDKIGDIDFASRGDSNITEIRLIGDNSNKFKVDLNGSIEINNTILDYENINDRSFDFEVIARNSKGYSNTANLLIRVHNVAETAPTLKDTNITTNEDVPINSTIGSVIVDNVGDTNISRFVLISGDGREEFDIDNLGNMKNIVELNATRQGLYTLRIYAINDFGNSNTVDIRIVVNEIFSKAPILGDTVLNVDENEEQDKVVGRVVITSFGDSDINDFILTGDGSEHFRIDNDGVIYVDNTNAGDIDYEANRVFNLVATATNEKGVSNNAKITINVNNIAEMADILRDTLITVEESAKIGSIIGNINIETKGDTNSTFSILGTGADDFYIHPDGRVELVKSLDFETKDLYNLKISARNSFGDSNEVDLTIQITNILEDEPTLVDTNLSVDENSPIGTVVGDINISSSGDSDIVEFELYGDNSDNFRVDLNGRVFVDIANLDFETMPRFQLFARAKNALAFGNVVNVIININNVAEIAPTLRNTNIDVDENVTVGSTIGRIDIASVGDYNITSFTLTGAGSANFTINVNGDIVLENNLDFEETNSYDLRVVASNPFGTSNIVTLNIVVNDIADVVPILEDVAFSIEENLTIGTYIGEINISNTGDSDIASIELFGENVDDFKVEVNGSIYTDKELDFETKPIYNLTARATNSAGVSNISDVVINIINIAENLPVVSDATFNVDENISIGTIIGQIDVTSIDSNITSATIIPTNLPFSVELNGTISTISDLDYETNNSYTFDINFTNDAGSALSNVVVNINNIPESLVTLSDLNVTIDENQTDGNEIGSITIVPGDTNTTNLELLGYGSKHFSIDSNGSIIVASASDIEYEKQSFYLLTVKATNEFGDSNSTIRITIRDVVPMLLTGKITALDKTSEDAFGTSVDTYGDYIIVGAPGQDTDRKNMGAAYIYKKSPSTSSFIQIEELQYNTTKANSYFGHSVAINNGYVAIGAYGDNKVYIYKMVGDDYSLIKTLKGDGQFGYSLDMDDELLFVGAPTDGTNNHGSAFGYSVTDDFNQVFSMNTISTKEGDNFGNAVALSKDCIVVAADKVDRTPSSIDSGAIYIFDKKGILIKKVFAQDSSSGDNFGYSVDMYDNIILVGAPNKDHNASNSQDTGAAYIIKLDENNQVSQNIIEPFVLDSFDSFGHSVSINRRRASIGAYNKNVSGNMQAGVVYHYNIIETPDKISYSLDSNTTAYRADIEQEANFGSAISSNDDYLVISAYHKNEDNMKNSGAVYIKTIKPDNRPYLINYDPMIYYVNDVRDFEASGLTTPISFTWTGGVLSIDANGSLSGAGANSPSEYTGNIVLDDGVNTMSYIITAIKKDISTLIGNDFLFRAPSWIQPEDKFTSSIAVNGANILVGSIGYDLEPYSDIGIVYRYNSATMNYEGNITLADINDTTVDGKTFFGSSIALKNNFAVIGAIGGDIGSSISSGTVYVIEDITSVSPTNSRRITSDDFSFTGDTIKPSDGFGNSISISNVINNRHYIAIGAYLRDGANGEGVADSGAVYIFTHTLGDPKITQIERLASEDIAEEDFLNNEEFGFAVDISGDSNYLIVGVPKKSWGNNQEAGAVYIFMKNSNDEYIQIDRIVLQDGSSGDHFGYSVSISDDGQYFVVGAPNDSINGYKNSGVIYLYKRDVNNRYIQVSKSGVYDSDYGDNLGNSIKLSGNYVAVGAYGKFNKNYRAGSVYLFKITNDKLYQIYSNKLDQTSTNEEFGTFVDIDSSNAPGLINLYSTSPIYNNRGRLFIFDILDN